MQRVKSKININNYFGQICVGDEGHTHDIEPNINGVIKVWFNKHKKESYWYSTEVKINDIKLVK